MKRVVLALLAVCATVTAQGAINVTSSSDVYQQTFDTLANAGTPGWTNDATLPGWSLFRQPAPGVAITAYSVDNGGSNAGAFKSFGTTASAERAFGGVGSGAAYFGSPASNTLAGWMAVAFTNATGGSRSGFSIGFDGEQWRNGGNTSAQSMVLEYGFGGDFGTVAAWTAPGGGFNWTAPITGASASALDGNAPANRVSGVGGAVLTPWAAGNTLWVRWVEHNDTGSDHGLAIDNFSLSVTAVPEPETYAMMLAGLVGVAAMARRRRDVGAKSRG